MRRVLVMSVCVMALAACQKKPGEQAAAASGEAAQTAAATAPAAPAKPQRKAGLWEISMNASGMQQVMTQCIDAASEADANAFANSASKTSCSKNEVTPTAGGWKFESVCDMGQGGTATTTGTATGDMATRYEVKATVVTSGSSMPQANGTHEMAITGEFKGACPAGMKPGDIQLANGMTINPAAMHAGAGSAPHMTPAQAEAMAKAMQAHQGK